jgi:hypothetical protein
MNVWHMLANLPKALQAVNDMALRIMKLHNDPKFQVLIASDPALAAAAAAISKDARDIQEAFK